MTQWIKVKMETERVCEKQKWIVTLNFSGSNSPICFSLKLCIVGTVFRSWAMLNVSAQVYAVVHSSLHKFSPVYVQFCPCSPC